MFGWTMVDGRSCITTNSSGLNARAEVAEHSFAGGQR